MALQFEYSQASFVPLMKSDDLYIDNGKPQL